MKSEDYKMKRLLLGAMVLLLLVLIGFAAWSERNTAVAQSTDSWKSWAVTPDSPARSAAAITPHNTNELARVTRAIYVGGGGNLTVFMVDDATSTGFPDVPPGSILPYRVRIVKATGTTATDIVGLY
jgi:hypothetical protein